MGNYKLSEDAKADRIRIHQRGVRDHGQTQADKYYMAFFDRFEQLAEQPYLYQAVGDVREGYRRSVCGIDGDTIEIMNIIRRQDINEALS